jgi:hypothetical protein
MPRRCARSSGCHATVRRWRSPGSTSARHARQRSLLRRRATECREQQQENQRRTAPAGSSASSSCTAASTWLSTTPSNVTFVL